MRLASPQHYWPDPAGRWLSSAGWRAILAAVIALLLLAACGDDGDSDSGADEKSPDASATVEAVVAVERALVFPRPDRDAEPFTTLYEREPIPVNGQTSDGMWILTNVDGTEGWVLAVQLTVSGDLTTVAVVDAVAEDGTAVAAGASTPTSLPTLSLTPVPSATDTPDAEAPPSRTPLPTRTPFPSLTPTIPGDVGTLPFSEDDAPTDPEAIPTSASIRAGEPPPLLISLPTGWDGIHLLVPFRTVYAIQDVPLTIYTGPLPDGATGHIYLFWGFPNIADPITGELNLWADGTQILRGAFVDQSCNLGLYDQETFFVGGLEALGAFYAAVGCAGEPDTAGWFAMLRVYGGSYAFFVAVEPVNTLPQQIANLQTILDTVEFLPPEAE